MLIVKKSFQWRSYNKKKMHLKFTLIPCFLSELMLNQSIYTRCNKLHFEKSCLVWDSNPRPSPNLVKQTTIKHPLLSYLTPTSSRLSKPPQTRHICLPSLNTSLSITTYVKTQTEEGCIRSKPGLCLSSIIPLSMPIHIPCTFLQWLHN